MGVNHNLPKRRTDGSAITLNGLPLSYGTGYPDVPLPGHICWRQDTQTFEYWDDVAGSWKTAVESVFGRTGVVVAAASDYDASQIDNDSVVAGTYVSDALNQLNTSILGLGSDNVANDSTSVGGATVTDALDGLLSAINGLGSNDITNDSTVPGGGSVTTALDALYTQVVALSVQQSTNTTNIAANAAAIAAAQPTIAQHTTDIATLQTDVVAADQWVMPIWAEENAALGATNTYEWAFGNGANTPAARGIPIYVPTGYSAEIVAVSLSLNAGTATVEVVKNGLPQGAAANVTVSTGNSAVNTLGTPLSWANGDVLNFRTTSSSGTSGPCHVCAFVRVYQT